jgi:hemoglobin
MNRVSPIHTPPEGPQGRPPSPEIYLKMGQENIFRMLSDFYKELEKSKIRPIFPPDMEEASRKSALFFVTLLGGPPLYAQTYGPPRMRARHLPFEIDEAARQVWLHCFDTVLEKADSKYNFPLEHLDGFKKFLSDFSKWMVNKN